MKVLIRNRIMHVGARAARALIRAGLAKDLLNVVEVAARVLPAALVAPAAPAAVAAPVRRVYRRRDIEQAPGAVVMHVQQDILHDVDTSTDAEQTPPPTATSDEE